MAEAGYPVETEEIRVFVGMGTIQEHPEHTTAYEADIRREASAELARYRAG